MDSKNCARIINETIEEFSIKFFRKTTRFQMTSLSLSKISGRSFINQVFINNLSSEIYLYGWCMFQFANTNYGFIKISSIKSWQKISINEVIE